MHFQNFPQHFVQILSGARSFAARMHWGRMLSNGFGRLHSNGYGHNWAVATDVTKIYDVYRLLENVLHKSYRVHGALLLRCIGIGCSRMALVGCTQMAADMSGLLQRMLPKLNDIHLAACIADSTFGLTPPPHEAAVAKCDFLNQNTQSMHFDTFQHSGKIASGGCTEPIGCTELCCLDALGSDAVEWLWSAGLKWLRT